MRLSYAYHKIIRHAGYPFLTVAGLSFHIIWCLSRRSNYFIFHFIILSENMMHFPHIIIDNFFIRKGESKRRMKCGKLSWNYSKPVRSSLSSLCPLSSVTSCYRSARIWWKTTVFPLKTSLGVKCISLDFSVNFVCPSFSFNCKVKNNTRLRQLLSQCDYSAALMRFSYFPSEIPVKLLRLPRLGWGGGGTESIRMRLYRWTRQRRTCSNLMQLGCTWKDLPSTLCTGTGRQKPIKR